MDERSTTPSISVSLASASPPARPGSVPVAARVELFVPGRVALFGEHSDWAGGFRRFNSAIVPGRCIVTGTNQGLFASAAKHNTHLYLRSVLLTGEEHVFSVSPFAVARKFGDTLAVCCRWRASSHMAYA